MKLDTATVDRLKELGATDDMLKWLEQPEAVRELLKHEPMTDIDQPQCPGCGVVFGQGEAHRRTGYGTGECPVATAWRALGDPRGAEDIERAWQEAIEADGARDLRERFEQQNAALAAHYERMRLAALNEARAMQQVRRGLAAEWISGDLDAFIKVDR